MATATERAAVGAEEAKLEGKGVVGQAVEAARNVRTGRDESGDLAPGHNNGVGLGHNNGTTVGDRGLLDHHHRHGTGVGGNYLGNTEEEMARLRLKTHITHEGDAYCPNPNIRDLVSARKSIASLEQTSKRTNIVFSICSVIFEI